MAGLGIGALVAVFMQRSTPKLPPNPVAFVTSTPAPAPTHAPIVIATIEPRRTPRPSPSPSPSPSALPTDAPSLAPTPTPPPTAKPASPSPQARVALAPPATAASTSRPLTASPMPTVVATPAAVAETESESTYEEHASAVVRRYLDALIRGDERTAYGALGGGGELSEQVFLDPGARIVSLKVTRIDASNASVGCEIATAKGNYYATYHIAAATSGPYISQHDFIKV